MESLDYVKVGPYIEAKGPLPNPDTNQRMYRIENGELTDITASFRKKGMG
jgi:anaerobic ribonucleoside-triphosphate reductase activating protein